MKTIQLPDVGKMLQEYIDKKSISQAALARELGIRSGTLAGYLKNQNIQMHTLVKIATALEHNFIREIADTLPASFEPTAVVDSTSTVANLQQQIVMLQKEVDTLKDAIKLLGGK